MNLLVCAAQVKYTSDARSLWVTTKASAPGGVRTEKVGLSVFPT